MQGRWCSSAQSDANERKKKKQQIDDVIAANLDGVVEEVAEGRQSTLPCWLNTYL